MLERWEKGAEESEKGLGGFAEGNGRVDGAEGEDVDEQWRRVGEWRAWTLGRYEESSDESGIWKRFFGSLLLEPELEIAQGPFR